jgi:hypothetical protein
MGNLQAIEMVAHTDLDTALIWHLTANHYPPLPLSLLPVAKRAIKKAKAGLWAANVSLRGTGVTYTRGKRGDLAPVRACVEAWHLSAFIEGAEDD